MSENNKPANFEDKLESLEALVVQMEEGKLSLDELLATYEKGVMLANSLKKDLESAQAKLSELKQGTVKPVEET
ncbi:MAG: exodeoxyribonuclease VII small subunit [Eubacteriales bacterium]|nr:exodeoxyribonuclease VII small subunit [Eubacteriales bacterium]